MSVDGETRVFAGIDEAGLGPLLGPLTIGWSAFRVPRGRVDLWRRLGRIVSREPADDRDRLVVADSKRVFTRNPRGARRLEATALAFLAQVDAFGRWPADPGELWRLAPEPLALPGAVTELHPWYGRLPARLPADVEPARLGLWTHLLGREMARQGVALVDAGVRPVPAGELNDSFRRTENKAATQWAIVARIVRWLWARHAREGLSLVVDRLGGRRHYAALLRELFPGGGVETVAEERGHAEYRVRDGEGRLRILFAERGEERSFSVALASCLAKYSRELAMRGFNAYFEELQPGLKPTAGYTTDGRRWLADAGPALARAGVPRSVLVRER